MPNGYNATDNYVVGSANSASGIVSNQPVSREFPITSGGSRNMVVKIVTSGVTQVGTLTLKLQTAIGNDWVDSKTATFTAAGNSYIKLLENAAGDQTFLPLLNKGRVVLTTTNAGDAATVDSVQVLQDL